MSVFQTSQQQGVLVAEVQQTVSSLAEQDVQHEMDALVSGIEQGQYRLVLIDLERVAYLGSTMLELFRRIWKPLRDHGGRLALCNVSQVGREVLEIAHFDRLWTIFESREAALKQLAGAPTP